MENLNVEVVENGFAVHTSSALGRRDRMWVFESPETLSEFMSDWGQKNMPKDSEPAPAEER